jgi:hypothetical protein
MESHNTELTRNNAVSDEFVDFVDCVGNDAANENGNDKYGVNQV